MTLDEEGKPQLDALAEANRTFARAYPGERAERQPVHTFYVGAHLFTADFSRRAGELAARSMATYARDPAELATGMGIALTPAMEPSELAAIHRRVAAKLEREPVEDLRIDFEDGFGARPDADEDQAAEAAARAVAAGMRAGLLPRFIGIRIKSFGEQYKARGARTLGLFIDRLLAESGGRLPDGFVVTLPKITVPEQARALVRLLEILERRHRLPDGSLRLELMIEVSQALLGRDGRSPLPGFLEACEGRCRGAHFGTYDFTASCNVAAGYQTMDHPLCELAKGLMVLAFAGTGIFLSDGATNVIPVGPHEAAAAAGRPLTPAELAENRAAVHGAWQLAHRHIGRSLRSGLYQGWDLHPAQLPIRYATFYAFFRAGFAAAAGRLRTLIEAAARTTQAGAVLDDAATGQSLLGFIARGLSSGAVDVTDAAVTGLTAEELALRSFVDIVARRRGSSQSHP
jgi:hypothetical protein